MSIVLANSSKDRAFTIIGSIGVLLGGIIFFICEWATGVGSQGVVNRLLANIGIALLGAGCIILGVLFAKAVVVDLMKRTSAGRKAALKDMALQFGTVLLNIVVYGGIFIIAMGGISALDGASLGTVIMVVAIWVLCVVAFIAYRNFRKKHAREKGSLFFVGVSFLLTVFGAAMAIVGISSAGGAIEDLQSGPATADVFIVDASIDHPSWRYRGVVQSKHVLTFYTADKERIVLEVPEKDIESAKIINDYGNFVHLDYYPNTQIFDGASKWNDGRQIMGEALLNELNEEYDFAL